ncbi:unnamed protein product [Auanema sp. JU1783]|nr:unnamed protein product [Auanema sp. JU1783]
MKDEPELIHQSLLADWQKADAVRTFLLPCLDFHLTNGQVRKEGLSEFDRKLQQYGKKWLHLPQRASPEVLYIPTSHGGLGFSKLNDLSNTCKIAYAQTVLNSEDKLVQNIAYTDAIKAVKRRLKKNPSNLEITEYFDGKTDGIFDCNSSDVSSNWTKLRIATRRLRTKLLVNWKINNDGALGITQNGNHIKPNKTKRTLRGAIAAHEMKNLRDKPDQGRIFDVSMIRNSSNHYLSRGDFIRFADWRFIHKARLNVLQLNGCRRQ